MQGCRKVAATVGVHEIFPDSFNLPPYEYGFLAVYLVTGRLSRRYIVTLIILVCS